MATKKPTDKKSNNKKSDSKKKSTPKKSASEKRAESDIAKGKKYAEDYFSPGSAGRLDGDYTTKFEEDTQSIAQLENAYQQAQAGNPYFEELMKKHMAGLEGFSGAEYQAMREQANREVDANTQTAIRTLRKSQGQNAVSGDAAAAQTLKASLSANKLKQQNESDLMAQAAKERTARLANASTFANEGYANNQIYSQMALKNLTDFRAGQQRLGTDVSQNNAMMRYNQDSFNLNQSNLERVNAMNASLGYAGVLNAYRQEDVTNDLTKKMLEEARKGL